MGQSLYRPRALRSARLLALAVRMYSLRSWHMRRGVVARLVGLVVLWAFWGPPPALAGSGRVKLISKVPPTVRVCGANAPGPGRYTRGPGRPSCLRGLCYRRSLQPFRHRFTPAVRGLRLWFQFLFLLDFFQRFQRALASLCRAGSVASTCSTSFLTSDAILGL